MRRRLWPWVALGLLLGLPLLALGAGLVLLDGEALRTRVEAAVTQASGRAFTLSGPVRLSPNLTPTVVLEGPSLGNLPGGSEPVMFTARRIRVQVALLPLLARRIEIHSVALEQPRLLLERDAQGRPNWLLGPARPGAAAGPTPPPPAPAPARDPFALKVAAISLAEGQVTWNDLRAGVRESLALPMVTLDTDPEGRLRGQGQLRLRGVEAQAQLHGGPLAALLAPGSGLPWPVELTLAARGVQANFSGSLAGGTLQGPLRVSIPRTDSLAPLLPQAAALPPAEGVTLAASLSPGGLSGISLGVQRLPLSGLLPELSLGPMVVEAASLGALSSARGTLRLGELALAWDADLPSADSLQRSGPWSFHAVARGAGVSAMMEGALPGATLAGLSLRYEARTQDLAALGAAIRQPLPGLRGVEAEGRLTGLPDGWLRLDQLRLEAEQVAAGGELRLRPGTPPRLEGRLEATRLDLDAIPPAAPPPSSPAPPSPPGPAVVPAPAPRPAAARRLIPALPLPLERLREAEGRLSLRLLGLRAGGIGWQGLEAEALLEGGALRLDPVRLDGPGGRLLLRAGADGAAVPPTLSLAVGTEGAGLDLAPLLAAAGQPALLEGRLEIAGELSGHGQTLRDWAASLDGPLGLAMVDGRLSGALLDRWGGLRRLLLPNLPEGGWVPLRCLALGLRAREGVAEVPALLLDTPLGNVTGGGRIDLRDEQLDLRLVPRARIGGTSISAPVRLTGRLAAPQPRVDPEAAGAAAASLLGALAAQRGGAAGAALGALLGGGTADCAGPLREARGGREGPQPAAPAEAAPGTRGGDPAPPAAPRVQDLLRGLLGR